jgi:hypothetical protein
MRSILPRAIEAALAAALLTGFAPAASAQEEARVDNIEELSDGYRCRAREMPELTLYHDWRGGDRSALWTGPAREAGGNDITIRVAFSPEVDRPSVPEGAVLGFVLNMTQKPLRDTPRTAQLRLDGIAQPAIRFEMEGSVREWSLTTPDHQRKELAARLMTVSIVDLDLADASGAPLGRFSWDIRRLRRVPEVLQSINWCCR